jgi:hypothetical protein
LENSKQSRKPLYIATGLTILALVFSLSTVSILLGTNYGLVFITVLITGIVLLGTLYIRLLTLFSFSSAINKIVTKVSKINMPNKQVETIKMDLPVLEIQKEKTSSKTNSKASKKVSFESKDELENSSQIIFSETQSTIIIPQREKCKVFENANLQQKGMSLKNENHKNSGFNKKDVPEGCNNFFGYLEALPIGASTPDECFACARLINCHKKSSC